MGWVRGGDIGGVENGGEARGVNRSDGSREA
jgi:hypothetical protein